MTKHYISSIPMQPEGSLKSCSYKYETEEGTVNHPRLLSFPILVSIDNTLKKGDDFQISVVVPDHSNVPANYERFKNELRQILEDKGIEFNMDKINEISVEYSEENQVHLKLFEDLITNISDDEKIYACITYGSKPMPMIILMALNYVYRFCKNTIIEEVVYGQFNHDTGISSVYDVSSLFYMNSAVNNIALMNVENPLEYIRNIISE